MMEGIPERLSGKPDRPGREPLVSILGQINGSAYTHGDSYGHSAENDIGFRLSLKYTSPAFIKVIITDYKIQADACQPAEMTVNMIQIKNAPGKKTTNNNGQDQVLRPSFSVHPISCLPSAERRTTAFKTRFRATMKEEHSAYSE